MFTGLFYRGQSVVVPEVVELVRMLPVISFPGGEDVLAVVHSAHDDGDEDQTVDGDLVPAELA